MAKRSRVQWATTFDADLLDMLRGLSAKTRVPAARLLDEAIEDLLVKYDVMDKSEKKNP